MPRENRIDELRHDGFVVPNDARKKFFPPFEFTNHCRAHLVFDGLNAVVAFLEFA
jgi:hypothetical protein